MTKLEKNIVATLIGGSIIVFGALYRKSNTTASNIIISLGIIILLISYFIINTNEQKPKKEIKISYLKNGLQQGKYYKYKHEPNTIIHLTPIQDVSLGKNFVDQNGEDIFITKDQLKTSIE